jgi:hypothetical protein
MKMYMLLLLISVLVCASYYPAFRGAEARSRTRSD